VVFDDKGKVVQHAVLRAGTGAIGVDIPHATWHTFVGLEPGSVIFEAKAGPYLPLAREETPFWAPTERDPTANAYLGKLHDLFRQEQAD